MNTEKKAMVYIQSGGPTAVINTSFYGAVVEAKKHPERISGIYGSRYGIEGLINDDLIDLNKETDEDIELLKQTPGSILGTTRRKLPQDLHDDLYMKIITTIKKHNIGYVFVNGGNDSMDTCNKLSKLCTELKVGCQVIGVPKTVDNDLAGTDHSLGFPSAAKHVINSFQCIAVDAMSYKKSKVYIVEIMGRNAGWLTASVDLLDKDVRPDLIYLPETKFDLDSFLKDVHTIYEKKGYVICAVSEGVNFERLNAKDTRVDSFGHAQLGGAAHDLAAIVEAKFDYPTRAIELSLMQRADPIYVSSVDRIEAEQIGRFAVELALRGKTGVMIGIERMDSKKEFTVLLKSSEIDSIANTETFIPKHMISTKEAMSEHYRNYLRPLIQGEVNCAFENGVLKRSKFKYIKVS